MRFRTLLLLVLFVPSVSAAVLVEDFEDYTTVGLEPDTVPNQIWYSYRDVEELGVFVTDDAPQGLQAWGMFANTTATPAENKVRFDLSVPAQVTSTVFTVNMTENSQQVITLQSKGPVRNLVKFYVFCETYCEFRVRDELADSTGQVLINETLMLTQFEVLLIFDWPNNRFNLNVNGVDDGFFDFLDFPENFGRLEFRQYRGDFTFGTVFDNWTVNGGFNATETTIEGDIVEGIKSHMDRIYIRSDGAQFFFGVILFFTLTLAALQIVQTFAKSNAILPGLSMFIMLVALWLVFIEVWPDWIGIAIIIATSAVIGLVVRRFALGIRDASNGPALVAGSLGYFIIASTLLGFAGYASDTVTLPTGSPQITDDSGNATTDTQSFAAATLECVITGGVFTFGLKGDCSRDTVSSTFTKLTNAASQIFGWVQVGLQFLFQLLTFQLPIPIIFNMMIVLPPAAALAAYAIQVIRGSS